MRPHLAHATGRCFDLIILPSPLVRTGNMPSCHMLFLNVVGFSSITCFSSMAWTYQASPNLALLEHSCLRDALQIGRCGLCLYRKRCIKDFVMRHRCQAAVDAAWQCFRDRWAPFSNSDTLPHLQCLKHVFYHGDAICNRQALRFRQPCETAVGARQQ